MECIQMRRVHFAHFFGCGGFVRRVGLQSKTFQGLIKISVIASRAFMVRAQGMAGDVN
jgi:hypothetical protein